MQRQFNLQASLWHIFIICVDQIKGYKSFCSFPVSSVGMDTGINRRLLTQRLGVKFNIVNAFRRKSLIAITPCAGKFLIVQNSIRHQRSITYA